MNAKKLSFLLLILVAVACTNRSTSSEQDEMRPVSYTHLDVYKRQYLHSQAVEERSELHTDDTAADDGKRSGQFLVIQCITMSPIGHFVYVMNAAVRTRARSRRAKG